MWTESFLHIQLLVHDLTETRMNSIEQDNFFLLILPSIHVILLLFIIE